jgi:hypothetical protein
VAVAAKSCASERWSSGATSPLTVGGEVL